MKKINYFFDEMPLWKVFVFTTIVVGGLFASVLVPLIGDQIVSTTRAIVCFTGIGSLFGLLMVLTNSMMRNSKKFWQAAKVLDDKISSVNTLDRLKELIEEFWSVNSLASGEIHWNEMKRIQSRIYDREAHLKEIIKIKDSYGKVS